MRKISSMPTSSFLEAYSADSIAANEYYSSLSIDEMPQGMLLAGIVRNTIRIPDMEESDSVAIK